jgi:hypothetical protein
VHSSAANEVVQTNEVDPFANEVVQAQAQDLQNDDILHLLTFQTPILRHKK